MKKEYKHALEKITFALYPVNRSLKNIRVIIKLTNAGVAATAHPTSYTSVYVTVV